MKKFYARREVNIWIDKAFIGCKKMNIYINAEDFLDEKCIKYNSKKYVKYNKIWYEVTLIDYGYHFLEIRPYNLFIPEEEIKYES